MKKEALSPAIPETAIRQRLADVRDIFYDRDVSAIGNRISLAEGGCYFPTPLPVLKKLADASANLTKFPHQIYPQQNVLPEFISSIWNYFSGHCSIPLHEDEDSVIFGFGSSHIFDMALSVLCDPTDIVLMPESYYHAFVEWPEKWKAQAERIKTDEVHGYKLTARDLETWFLKNPNKTHRVKCLVLTSPTTTGAIYEKHELEEISKIVNKYSIYVYSDEVFRDTIFPGEKCVSPASLSSLKPWTITASSGSKSRSVADIRIGWACGPKTVIEKMIWHMEHSITEVPLYLQSIGKSIIDEIDQDFLESAAREYQERVSMIVDLVDHSNRRLNLYFKTRHKEYIRIPYIPRAGHYICLDFGVVKDWTSKSGKKMETGQDLCRYMYHNHSINSNNDQINHGICLSSGYSKGHDNFVMYMAFAQSGYQLANAEYESYARQEIIKHLIKSYISPNASDLQIEQAFSCLEVETRKSPDLKNLAISGRSEIIEAFDRIVSAVKGLKPA